MTLINPLKEVAAAKSASRKAETAANMINDLDNCPACRERMKTLLVRVDGRLVECAVCMDHRICLPLEKA